MAGIPTFRFGREGRFTRAPPILRQSRHQRFNVLGALDAVTHELIMVTNDIYINAGSVCELLHRIAALRLTVPITLILDNARYQKCRLVRDLALSLGIELLFLPTYSPNLNRIERLWRFVKKQGLYSIYYNDFAVFKQAISACLDRALILVDFAAALWPSELARLDIAALTRHEDGIALFPPWRKNDQEVRGTTVWLTDLCPVRALEAWLAAAAVTEGPLFRRLWHLPPPRVRRGAKRKSGAERYRMRTNPIDTDSIALVIKKWTGIAGFDGAAFAGHSLRRGAISSGVAQGVHIAWLKQFSGHASLKSLEEYVELDELRLHHPLKDVL
jgi:transposase